MLTRSAATLVQPCITFVVSHRRQVCFLVPLVLFVASLLRYWVSYDPDAALPRGFGEAISLARSLHDEGTFSNPFGALKTGPSAHLSPVFPAFLALLMKVFGVGSVGHYSVLWAARLILALQLALYPTFSRILGMGQINGILAASIWIVAKPLLAEGWEAIYASMLVATACCCYRLYLARDSNRRRRMAWFLGCLVGLLIFTLPSMILVYAAWVAREIWRRRSAFLKESFVPLILLPVLVITPWTVRNSLAFHRFLFIRDNLGLELAVSHNDCSRFGVVANIASGCFDKVHPNHNLTEATKVLEMGEVNYNDLRLREALQWIDSHLVRSTKLTLMRVIAFWFPTETFTIPIHTGGRRWERLVIYLMTLLSVFGLVMLYRRDVTSVAVMFSCLTLFPLTYYVLQFQDRFRYPIMWMTFLLGAMPIAACVRRLGENWRASSGLPGGRNSCATQRSTTSISPLLS
jgi:hypothetical protein